MCEQPRNEPAGNENDCHQNSNPGYAANQRQKNVRQSHRRLLVARRQYQDRKQNQHEHREQVFDDQPTHRDVARGRVQIVVVREHAQQDDGAGHGNRQSEQNASRPGPAKRPSREAAQQGGNEALAQSAGDCHAAYRQQVFHLEVKPHAKHQQNDTDLRHLIGRVLVGNKAGRSRTNGDPRQQIADDWR